jgi:hypothetical protein
MAQQYVEIITYATLAASGGSTKASNNVWHFYRSAAVLGVVKSQIESAFQTAIMTPLLATLGTVYGQTGTSVRFFDDAMDAPIIFTETGVGGLGTARSPDFEAVTLRLRTGIRGKPFRGYKHFSGVVEASSLGDALTTGALTAFGAVCTALMAGFTDASGNIWLPGIKTNKSPAQYRTNPTNVIFSPLVSATVNPLLTTMRRRRAKAT